MLSTNYIIDLTYAKLLEKKKKKRKKKTSFDFSFTISIQWSLVPFPTLIS